MIDTAGAPEEGAIKNSDYRKDADYFTQMCLGTRKLIIPYQIGLTISNVAWAMVCIALITYIFIRGC